MNINNTNGIYKLEEKLFGEYTLLWGIYFPRFNSSWVSVHISDEAIADSILSKYIVKKVDSLIR